MFDIRHPQLERLIELNRRITAEFADTGSFDPGLGELGLATPGAIKYLANGDYWCTPINTAAFGWTGGDGRHYSLLAIDGVIHEASPVILTRPDYSDYTSNVVAGQNLYDFLCLGRHTGFFNFLYSGFDDAFHAGGQFASHLTDSQRTKLDLLAAEFALEPWPADGGARFERLQSIKNQLQFKPDTGW
jgi:hypothetical protein